MTMRMPKGLMVCTLVLGFAAAGCAARQGPVGGDPKEQPGEEARTCGPGNEKEVQVHLELKPETVAANDQIADTTQRVCKGDKVFWKITNKSGLRVNVTIGQFREVGNPANKPDPIDFGFFKDDSESVEDGGTGWIDGKVKRKSLPRVIKYYIFLKTDHLETLHDPRLEIIDA